MIISFMIIIIRHYASHKMAVISGDSNVLTENIIAVCTSEEADS